MDERIEYLRGESENERLRHTINDQAAEIERLNTQIALLEATLSRQWRVFKEEIDRLHIERRKQMT